MSVELEEGESYSAEMIFHVNQKDVSAIFQEEIDKAVANIKERVEEYLVSHIRVQNFETK